MGVISLERVSTVAGTILECVPDSMTHNHARNLLLAQTQPNTSSDDMSDEFKKAATGLLTKLPASIDTVHDKAVLMQLVYCIGQTGDSLRAILVACGVGDQDVCNRNKNYVCKRNERQTLGSAQELMNVLADMHSQLHQNNLPGQIWPPVKLMVHHNMGKLTCYVLHHKTDQFQNPQAFALGPMEAFPQKQATPITQTIGGRLVTLYKSRWPSGGDFLIESLGARVIRNRELFKSVFQKSLSGHNLWSMRLIIAM